MTEISKAPLLKRGIPIEFSMEHHGFWPPRDPSKMLFGILAKTGRLGDELEIETTRGIVKSKHIHSYGWSGWMPEEIIKIWEKHNPTSIGEIEEFE